MDKIYYRNFNIDLLNFSDKELEEHYNNFGKNENRIINESTFDQLNDFDLNFYINLNKDLDFKMNYFEYRKYFFQNNINENRIYNEKIFNKFYPSFNLEFYKNCNKDLIKFSFINLLSHYHEKGRFENRIININIFNDNFPNFNLEYYKKFNPNLEFNNYIEYIYYLCRNYKNYYDYKIENYYDIINNLHPYFEKIQNLKLYREISNFSSLLIYNNKSAKEYFIYNKETFYLYYKDFDYDFYKNKYFKNSSKSELEILSYYHLEGKYKKQIINKKYKIIIYTPALDISCGGIVALHNLAKIINEINHPKFYAKILIYNNLRYENIFCNYFEDFMQINDNSIIIYPECITKNPLNGKNIVRWILLELGIEMPHNHYINFGSNDIIYHWEPKYTDNKKILRLHWLNPVFFNKNIERNKICFLIKKGRLIHNNINILHPLGSIDIENLPLYKIANIFNESTYFFCYDPKTMYIIYAILCGCIPVIYPIENKSKEEYIKSSILYKDNKIYDKGIAYGISTEEISYANNTKNLAKEELLSLFESDKNTVVNFLNDLDKIF